jgi:antirestriction protein ArdC
MSNANDSSKNPQANAVPEIPPGPVPAPAPRNAGSIPDPPLPAAGSDGPRKIHSISPYQIVTDRIVGLLEAGVVPWKASWVRQGYRSPQSFVTRKPYRGINHLLLGVIAHVQGYSSPYWLTYRQATELGGHVHKGEKGFPCFFWKVFDGNDSDQERALASEPTDSNRKRFVARYYTVFSLDQCDGIEPPPAPQVPMTSFTPIDHCERILAGYDGPAIDQGNYDPCYLPLLDRVRIPAPELFQSPEDYYATLFHEISHSSGHATRLGRFSKDEAAPFASREYSKEELIAELASAFLCAEAGIGAASIDDQAAYIAGWLHALENDNRLIVMAAAQAEKAADFILGRKPESAITD